MSEAISNETKTRHGLLFDLIRQHNIAAHEARTKGTGQTPDAAVHPRDTRRALLPQEQQALGITASFGR